MTQKSIFFTNLNDLNFIKNVQKMVNSVLSSKINVLKEMWESNVLLKVTRNQCTLVSTKGNYQRKFKNYKLSSPKNSKGHQKKFSILTSIPSDQNLFDYWEQ